MTCVCNDCRNCNVFGNCQYCNDSKSYGIDYAHGAFNYTNFISQ